MTRTLDKREHILDIAAPRFAENPPDVVTMEQVAKDAGVAKGTLYLYFPSKDDLLEALLISRQDRLDEAIQSAAGPEGDPWSRLRAAVEAAFCYQAGDADGYRLRRRYECAPFASESFRGSNRNRRERFQALIREAVPARRGLDEAELILGAVDAAVRANLGAPESERRDAAAGLWRFVSRALEAPALAGRTVLVTREEAEGGALGAALESRGARVVRIPLLETQPADPADGLARAASRLETYDWVVLTSARAVAALRDAGVRGARPVRLAVVGKATANAARELGWEPVVVGHGGGASLVASLRDAGFSFQDASVLLAAADIARPEAARDLEEAGAKVDIVTAYCTVTRSGARRELAAALKHERFDAVAFTSPSAAEAFRSGGNGAAARIPVAAAIGATTAEALKPLGFGRVVVASRPGLEALADAITQVFQPEGN
jgi:uroporphyrinogen-III synthase